MKNKMEFQKPKKILSTKASEPRGNSVIEILRFEYSSRCEKNSAFSMRSFARFLNVSHTLLSLVMNGHRTPSKKFIETVGARLSFSPEQTNLLMQSTPFIQGKKKIKAANITYNKISLDTFSLLSEWQHYAILSLLEIEDTEFTIQFISKRLNINEMLAKISIQRLLDLKLIECIETRTGRKWKQSTAPIVVENLESTVYTRKFQKQLITKAIDSMENDPVQLRDMSATTFAMDPQHVGYALKRIREFRRELVKELEELGQPKEVYNITVQLFPTSTQRGQK